MAFSAAMRVETQGRYSGVQNSVSAQLGGTLGRIEMSANNVFNEVEKRLSTPEAAISALESESDLNPDVRGYFAAFVPNFFPEKGTWFEPYVHHNDTTGYTVSQVGSARHDYTKSPWFIRARNIKMAFWSDPLERSLFLLRRYKHQRSLLHLRKASLHTRRQSGLRVWS